MGGLLLNTQEREKFERIARELKILRCIECMNLSQENITKIFEDAIKIFHMPSVEIQRLDDLGKLWVVFDHTGYASTLGSNMRQ